MSARDDYAELYRLTIGVGVLCIEDAETQADEALDEIDRLRAYLDEEYETTKRLRAELRSMDGRLTRSQEYTGLHCCQDRSCGCWDGRAVIEHLQEAYDELSDEAQEVREMWRACVDKIDAVRTYLFSAQLVGLEDAVRIPYDLLTLIDGGAAADLPVQGEPPPKCVCFRQWLSRPDDPVVVHDAECPLAVQGEPQ